MLVWAIGAAALGIGVVIGVLAGVSVARRRAHEDLVASESGRQAAVARALELSAEMRRRDEQLEQVRADATDAHARAAAANARLGAEREKLEEQRKLLADAEAKLVDVFQARSAEALQNNSVQFLELAKAALATTLESAKGDLGERQKAIEGLVIPIKETLTKYEQKLTTLEEQRQKEFAQLGTNVEGLSKLQQSLQKETSALVNALKSPQGRGRWGEIALKRVVEIAGMTQYCDFSTQVSVDGEEGRQRPDLVVHLPGDREVIVDSKVPLASYLEHLQATSDADRKDLLLRHARSVRAHVTALSAKDYTQRFAAAAEFTILFLPNEAIFGAALEHDPTLLEDALERRVVLATPMTLVAILRTIEHGWRQVRIEENAEEIRDLGRDLYDRIVLLAEKLGSVGTHLERTVKSYNDTIGSYQQRLVPGARKLAEYGAGTQKAVLDLETVDVQARLVDRATDA